MAIISPNDQAVNGCEFIKEILYSIAPASVVTFFEKYYFSKKIKTLVISSREDLVDACQTLFNCIESDFPHLSFVLRIVLSVIDRTFTPPEPQEDLYSQKLRDELRDLQALIQDELRAAFTKYFYDWQHLVSISNEMYESQEARGIAVALVSPNFLNSRSINSEYKLIRNELPVRFHRIHGARKFLQSISANYCALLMCDPCGGYNSPQFVGSSPLPLVSGTYPIIVFRKHMEWELHLPEPGKSENIKCILDLPSTDALIRYEAGRFCVPTLDFETYLKKYFANNSNLPQSTISDLSAFLLKLGKSHGALAVIGPNVFIRLEAKRLSALERGYRFDKPIPLSELANETRFLAQIAQVDGALLCSRTKCYGFGFILDGKAKKGSLDRGARFNSGLSYIKSHFGFIAIIQSEDGMIDIV